MTMAATPCSFVHRSVELTLLLSFPSPASLSIAHQPQITGLKGEKRIECRALILGSVLKSQHFSFLPLEITFLIIFVLFRAGLLPFIKN